MGSRLFLSLVLLGVVCIDHAPAQTVFPPATLTNLQVLPKDTPPQAVIREMRGMTVGLGVRCQYCHVGREGMPLEQFNFASDEVDKKAVARSMIRLVRTINLTLADRVGSAGPVTCYTCHRGSPRPVHAPPPPPVAQVEDHRD